MIVSRLALETEEERRAKKWIVFDLDEIGVLKAFREMSSLAL